MKTFYILCLSLTISIVNGLNSAAQTVTLRGKLLETNGTDTVAASSVAVTLMDSLENRTMPVYSQSDGLYYVYDVAPETYILEIWVNTLKNEPVCYKVHVCDNLNHYFDIAPILIKKEEGLQE